MVQLGMDRCQGTKVAECIDGRYFPPLRCSPGPTTVTRLREEGCSNLKTDSHTKITVQIYNTKMTQERYKLVYRVLPSHLHATKSAIFAAGAGIHANGKYIQVSSEAPVQGQFIPVAEAGAVPHTGEVGKLETVDEIEIGVLCIGRELTKTVVEAMKK